MYQNKELSYYINTAGFICGLTEYQAKQRPPYDATTYVPALDDVIKIAEATNYRLLDSTTLGDLRALPADELPNRALLPYVAADRLLLSIPLADLLDKHNYKGELSAAYTSLNCDLVSRYLMRNGATTYLHGVSLHRETLSLVEQFITRPRDFTPSNSVIADYLDRRDSLPSDASSNDFIGFYCGDFCTPLCCATELLYKHDYKALRDDHPCSAPSYLSIINSFSAHIIASVVLQGLRFSVGELLAIIDSVALTLCHLGAGRTTLH